ncbi:DEAD/DEAH box helicase [Solicola gregarius]|uniref:DEAD/DEAH box helicase n=1 Tax=Solicola gregarius TaxID=2908642 RepID=A0AA46TKI2_9ACTN|nr:DEAD/DEAH box helicase [Solicola gregarius]UYM06798.1 DEAD/DEAH box helicase [Solicola gregarius]
MSLTDLEVCFAPGDPAREGRVVFWGTNGNELTSEARVLVPGDDGVEHRDVRAHRSRVEDAVPALLLAYRDAAATPSAAWWGAATALALDLVGRGRILSRLASGDVDEWRAGPLDAEDLGRIDELVASMPATARALRDEGADDRARFAGLSDGSRLPDAQRLLRAYLDACADVLPRLGDHADPSAPYATPSVVARPELREWADELAGGLRIVLRVEHDVDAGDDSGDLAAALAFYAPDEPARVLDADRLWSGAHDFGPRAQVDAALAIRRAARVWPPLERLLDRAVPDRIQLSDDETGDLVGVAGERLRDVGVEVRWPRSLVTDVRVRAHIGSAGLPGPSALGGDRVFDFRWQVAVGDRELSKAELDRLAESTRPVVRLRDQWVVISGDVAARARERSRTPLSGVEAISAALSGRVDSDRGRTAEVAPAPALAELRDRIAAREDGDEPLGQPVKLQATLRDYQLRGVRWLDRMTSLGLGCCLADDMGLGKTITLIALHLVRHERDPRTGPTLVVCPASLMGNWEREVERFAPGTPVRRFHGQGRSVDDVRDGFVLTTYGTMRRDAERLGSVAWGLVVADEAQHVKNHRSSTARELRRIGADARVALTGTPVENNLAELWAILDWAVPGLLGTPAQFARQYAGPIESERDAVVAERLKRLVGPFMLRRHKTDPGIAPELPRKTETDQFVSLTDEQIGLYEAAVREGMSEVTAGGAAIERRGRIFAMLTALKQICNHPAQYLREDEPRLPGRSGKLELLDELLDVILSEDGAALVFTQYVAMARLLRRHLVARGVDVYLLDGSTPVARRQEMVDGFQAGEVSVFLLSLKAAGTGLNLTRADHVVHYDRWWNPAVEDQATDRAYRIGQTRPVQVHRMVVEGTIEDRIAAMLGGKRQLAAAVLEVGRGVAVGAERR